jgi:tryptophan synthase beta chain
MEKAGEYPDVVIGCVGGGSNFAGIAFPFLREKMQGKKIRFVAVEPEACPTLTRGVYAFDYGDTAKLAPVVKMYTLGHDFMPSGIHAGGLRYHGMSPLISLLYDQKLIEAVAVHQNPVFAAALQFIRTEAIIPAPESAHAIRVAIDEALRCKREGRKETILFNLSGHGHFDMAAYENYLHSNLTDFAYPAEKVAEALKDLPQFGA